MSEPWLESFDLDDETNERWIEAVRQIGRETNLLRWELAGYRWRKKNPETFRKNNRKNGIRYYQKHREKCIAHMREYHKKRKLLKKSLAASPP